MVLRIVHRRRCGLAAFLIGLSLPLVAVFILTPHAARLSCFAPNKVEPYYQQQIDRLKRRLAQRDAALGNERELSARLQRELQDASRQIQDVSRQIAELTVFRHAGAELNAADLTLHPQPTSLVSSSLSGGQIVTGANLGASSRQGGINETSGIAAMSAYAPKISPSSRHAITKSVRRKKGSRNSKRHARRTARFSRPSRLGYSGSARRKQRANKPSRRSRPRSFFDSVARQGVFGAGYAH